MRFRLTSKYRIRSQLEQAARSTREIRKAGLTRRKGCRSDHGRRFSYRTTAVCSSPPETSPDPGRRYRRKSAMELPAANRSAAAATGRRTRRCRPRARVGKATREVEDAAAVVESMAIVVCGDGPGLLEGEESIGPRGRLGSRAKLGRSYARSLSGRSHALVTSQCFEFPLELVCCHCW